MRSLRLIRHTRIPGSAENERPEEIREGLAQYTGTVLSASSTGEAAASAIEQLVHAEGEPTFVRTFAYSSGAAWGLLLDASMPGWQRRVDASSDLGRMLMAADSIQPAENAEAAASRYNAPALRTEEEKRDLEQKARVAELRRRFVDGPVLIVPGASGASFVTTGATPIPDAGTVFSSYRVSGEWGSFETTSGVLVRVDGRTLSVPAPARVDGPTITGDGWTLTLAQGWVARPGPRTGDYQVVRAGR